MLVEFFVFVSLSWRVTDSAKFMHVCTKVKKAVLFYRSLLQGLFDSSKHIGLKIIFILSSSLTNMSLAIVSHFLSFLLV